MGAERCTAGLSGLSLLAAALLLGGPAPGVLAAGDDIAGTVTSAAGPEAGVWVIAETGDFDTSFRKTVVTDDAGRFLVPDLPAASYEVWVRGYGLVDSEKTAARPGDQLDLTVRAAATPREAAEIYPANYWYSLLEVPPASDFPGDRPARQRHRHRHAHPGRLDRPHEGRLPALPPARQPRHARDAHAGPRRLRLDRRRLELPHPGGRGGAGDGGRDQPHRPAAGDSALRGVDGPHPRRRGAAGAAAAAGRRAQRGPHVVGLGAPPRDGARQRLDRQARPHALSERADLRRGRGGARHHRHRQLRVGAHGPADPHRAPPARHLLPGFVDAGTVALLGRRAGGAGEPERPQPDDGRPGPPLDHPGGAAQRRARLVPGGVGPPVRAVLPDSAPRRVAAGVVLRPRDRRVRAHRHLLLHPPPAVRRRRRRHPVAERLDRGGGLAEHPALRRDRRRAGRPGLVPDRHRHQRRRRHHPALERARSGRRGRDRPGAGHPHRQPRQVPARLRHHSPPGRLGLDHPAVPGAGAAHPDRAGRQPAGDLQGRGLRAALRSGRRPRSVGLRPARHRRRPQRARVDGAGGQRPRRQLRPRQVPGARRVPRRPVSTASRGGPCTRRPDRA